MDVQLLTELYTNVITAARLLDCDADYVAKLEADLKKFPPMQISKEGYLQEWLEDYKEVDVHHRHVSHLYGLHPGNLISPESTPELAEACRMTLNRRGDEGTGWSRAWKINFWARLGDGNRAWKLFQEFCCILLSMLRREVMVAALSLICSVRILLSRLMATTVARRESAKCCCKVMKALSICFLPCRIAGLPVTSVECAYAAVLP